MLERVRKEKNLYCLFRQFQHKASKCSDFISSEVLLGSFNLKLPVANIQLHFPKEL